MSGNFGLDFDRVLMKTYVDALKSDLDALQRSRHDPNERMNKFRFALSGLIAEFNGKSYASRNFIKVQIKAAKARIEGDFQGLFTPFTLRARSSLSLGSSSPLGQRLYVDHVTGWPIVPGKSLKSVASRWALFAAATGQFERAGIDEEDFDGLYYCIFGCAPMEGLDGLAGGVNFESAWFDPDTTKIVEDVVNPHYGDALQSGHAPADYIDPTPSPFLAIETGSRLWVGLTPRQTDDTDLLDLAFLWLQSGLAEFGVGGKTVSSGFGRFGFNEADRSLP